MILNGNQRGGARQMALHLLNGHSNEHVSVHEVSGFISNDVHGALNEAYALSKGTKCRQFMYSLSLSPPQEQYVSIECYKKALERIEKKLDLEGQPRVFVFHEKEGRRHAHCVWSRIDAEEMKAINISHPKRKLRTISRELYLENGWNLPKGLIDSKLKNPLNFTRAESEQAQRTQQSPKDIKSALQDSWMISDSKKAFEQALRERGYYLAKGDRRGFVAVDTYGEIYSLSRQIGVKQADLKNRLGKPQDLPSIEETKKTISALLTKQITKYMAELQDRHKEERLKLAQEKSAITQKHRTERQHLKTKHKERWRKEELRRSARMRKGFKGLWDRLTGTYQRTRKKNELETEKAKRRDRSEKEQLIAKQLKQRQPLQKIIQAMRTRDANDRAKVFKGMERHFQKIEKQQQIRKLYERQRRQLKYLKWVHEPDVEPDL